MGQATRYPLNVFQATTYSQHHTNAFSFSANQAALAYSSTIMAGIFSERQFMLKELSFYQVAATLPTRSGNFGITGTYVGNISNTETEVGLAYGRKLSNNIAIGGQFNYYTQRIPQYYTSGAFSIEAGVVLKINDQVQAGFHIYNPNGSKVAKTEERLPAIYTVGFGYEPSDRFMLSGEVLKIEDEKVNFRALAGYQFDKRLYARLGVNTAQAVYTVAGGVQLSNLSLEVMTAVHPQLGITPGLAILFQQKEKK
jgi:hypothetical protein